MITFENKTFRLDTKNSSYVMRITNAGYLLHLYYGKKIGFGNLQALMQRAPTASFSPTANDDTWYTHDSVLEEYSQNGSGDMRISAIAIRGIDGCATTELKYKSHRIYDGKEALAGLPASYDNGGECQTLEITMTDSHTGADVLLSYSVFEKYDAIAKSVRVINNGKEAFDLERILSACYDLPYSDYDLIQLYGQWSAERRVARNPLHNGIQQVSSKRGSSSHMHNPFVALAKQDSSEYSGDVFGFTLVYSANFTMECEVDCFGQTRLLCGINPDDFSWHLDVGESFTAPECISVYSPEGLWGMSNRFHKLIQRNICRGKYKLSRRPILVNNWEGTMFNFDDEKIVAIAKDAAELGLEMLVMDDGWFGHRDNDHSSLGDWYVYKDKIKGGLPSMVERINALGLKFGIWFEPEMISPDSDLYRAHPDYALHVEGRPVSLARNQLVLDMSRKDVQDNIFEQMAEIIRSANIVYIKWDFNRNLSEVGSALLAAPQQKELFHRYVLGVYALLERLTEEFPDLLMEGCSGGGGRFDCGMLYYFPQIWTSDNTDAMDRCLIQWGTSYIYPSSAISAHVAKAPHWLSGRRTPLKTRGDVAMAGTFGYELDLNKMSQEDKDYAKIQIEDYKKYYNLINFGNYYRLVDPYKTNSVAAWEYVNDEKTEALVTYVIMRYDTLAMTRAYPRGLDENTVYNVETDKNFIGEFSGDTLMNVGIPVARGPEYSSVVIHIIKK